MTDVAVATCRICGCSSEQACEGGCFWVPDPDDIGPLCSSCEALYTAEDPYAVEQARHGERGRGVDGPTRDRIRARTDCPRCEWLTVETERAFMGAFIAGTGPWAGLG